MADFPWFKFTADKWLGGKVQFQPYEYQAVFINICALCWRALDAIALQELCTRYPRDKQMLEDALLSLSESGLIVYQDDGRIIVKFLMEQLEDTEDISAKRSAAAHKRWSKSKSKDASAMQVHTVALQKNAEKKREELDKKREEGECPPAPDDGDPCKKPDQKPKLSEDQLWSMERLEPWATELRSLGAKMGPGTWKHWKRLHDEYPTSELHKAVSATNPERRWASNVEEKLRLDSGGKSFIQ